jgi:hypothetical protein
VLASQRQRAFGECMGLWQFTSQQPCLTELRDEKRAEDGHPKRFDRAQRPSQQGETFGRAPG